MEKNYYQIQDISQIIKMNPINWVKSRIDERTSWDGAVLIICGVLVLIAGPFAKLAAWAAIGYGAWTLWKREK